VIRTIQRFRDDRQGVAAVEFALVFPAIFLLHIAAAEALEVYLAQRNVAHIATAAGDILARNRAVTNADIDDALNAATVMIYPFPAASLQQRVSSISANASGVVTADWTVLKGYTAAGSASVPSGYLLANESVIVTDVIYDYKPAFGFFLPKTIRFTRHAYVRPRLSAKVDKTG